MGVERLPNESDQYLEARAELEAAEVALMEQRERVAEMRRALPPGPVVEQNYTFRVTELADAAGTVREASLSDLFDDPSKPLVLVHFMYGKKQKQPCPMCTTWADGYDGIVPHLRRRVNFGIVIAGGLAEFRAYAAGRGWRNLRVVSAEQSSFKADLKTESAEGAQEPAVSVFVREADGSVRHSYTGGARFSVGKFRGMDLLSPLWSFLDLTPEGRGDFFPSRVYD